MFYAHSADAHGRPEPLAEHLRDVAARAAEFASAFGAGEEAHAAGLLHDLGKYAERFLRRLAGLEPGLDHWSLGAWAALSLLGSAGFGVALAILGHHAGLGRREALEELGRLLDVAGREPHLLPVRHPLGLDLTEPDLDLLLDRFEADGFELPRITSSLFDPTDRRLGGAMLDVRMLFSALVDADHLETAAHFERDADGNKVHRPVGLSLDPAAALALVQAHVASLAQERERATGDVVALRSDLFEACLAAGARPRGVYTLTAPTGAGKTLAMLAFALHHAVAHGLRRVVVVIPYLSIIEQTAREYRRIFHERFGEDYVLEHHSLAGTRDDADREEPDAATERAARARSLAENWDAPLVVTTSVQLLESLLGRRPRACRKLHRLAKSVILFDEVQTLPPRLAVPTLATLSRLATERYGSTVVFSTATQPAFHHLHEKVTELAAPGWSPREIAPAPRLFSTAGRVRKLRVDWRLGTKMSWDEIADELAARGRALCIVNLKRHARGLAERLERRGVVGLLHLSTAMCPAHRRAVLAEVGERLARREPCLLVSTQCVEAGVDVDFPVVFRVFGPLDAIAQAMGRCNRGGTLVEGGEVVVFRPEEELYPDAAYGRAAAVLRGLVETRGVDWIGRITGEGSHEVFETYYRALYDLEGLAGAEQGRSRDLREAIDRCDFETVARLYRLIDKDAVDVLVPYDRAAFDELRTDVRRAGLKADWIRRARPHAVSLYRSGEDAPKNLDLEDVWVRGRDGRQRSDEWYVLNPGSCQYHERFGLAVPGAAPR